MLFLEQQVLTQDIMFTEQDTCKHGKNRTWTLYAKTRAQTHKYTSILIFGAIAIEGITPALYCLAPDQTGFITF